MAKLSALSPKTLAATSAIRTKSDTPDTLTYEGGEGYSRKPKSELFLLAVTNMVGEDTFYEGKGDRDLRYRDLISKVVQKDPDWVRRFVPFLRNEMNMRSASIVMAVEYVIAGGPSGRGVIDSAIVRADEPAEVIGYYRSRVGRALPQPIKRGVADAVRRLYNERSSIKYDTSSATYRFGDVIDIVHPEPKAGWQSSLFRYSLESRHNRDNISLEGLEMIQNYRKMLQIPVDERRGNLSVNMLSNAGMTWENVSGWLQGPMDSVAWEAIIPSMGYMALIRNLRNFEQAGISDEARTLVKDKIMDPEEIAKSRQFPLRFYGAFKNVESLDVKAALEIAMSHVVGNIPLLKGNTLILVDNSGSMGEGFSAKGTITQREQAGLFGAALAKRCENATLVAYADTGRKHGFTRATPVLRLAKAVGDDGTVGGGTNTFGVLQDFYDGHDRIVILTDEQAWSAQRYGYSRNSDIEKVIETPIYTFNVAGYKMGHMSSGGDKRYTFGGLTDAGFKMMALIEAGQNADWPF